MASVGEDLESDGSVLWFSLAYFDQLLGCIGLNQFFAVGEG